MDITKIEFMYDISHNKRILFNKLEELYENCDYRSLKYTKKFTVKIVDFRNKR